MVALSGAIFDTPIFISAIGTERFAQVAATNASGARELRIKFLFIAAQSGDYKKFINAMKSPSPWKRIADIQQRYRRLNP
ncbi:hypothetical protein [Stutzerimonas stutzeri]|uniref:hypothetical protein n=1 Tax=Stutzerimonas stutzeri TaxID=316 RepID=UPI0015E2F358|nr:hypothetical protein [Stutzerimonas stutzeri]MBA1276363.1 hypothetical protein [Stutzerimonas stutzeri]